MVQMHPTSFLRIYSASVRGSLFKGLFHSVLLNVRLTFAVLRIFSLAASHPQDATVLSLTGRKRNIQWLYPFLLRVCIADRPPLWIHGFQFFSIRLNINISLDHSGYSQL